MPTVQVIRSNQELRSAVRQAMVYHGDKSDLNHLDVSALSDFSNIFQKTRFNGDISQWDVSQATDMSGMFQGSHFNGDISAWNVSKVVRFSKMFLDASFNGDISGWDVSKVTTMARMFENAAFNGDLAGWNMANVEDVGRMFQEGEFAQDISGWQMRPNNTVRMFWGNEHGAAKQSRTPDWFIPVRIETDGDFKDPLWQQAMEGYRATHLALGLHPNDKVRDVTALHASLRENADCSLPELDMGETL